MTYKGGAERYYDKTERYYDKTERYYDGGERYYDRNFVVIHRQDYFADNYSFLQTACAFPLALCSMRPLAIISSRSSSRIAAISASLNFRIGLVCCARSLSQFNAYRWVESALVVISRCRDLAKSCPCPI